MRCSGKVSTPPWKKYPQQFYQPQAQQTNSAMPFFTDPRENDPGRPIKAVVRWRLRDFAPGRHHGGSQCYCWSHSCIFDVLMQIVL